MEKFQLTYFESALLIAVLLFKEQNIDIAIVEAGLGGRWDASKVHDPILTAITNVGLDHTKWLGETLEEISDDKTELIYPKRPAVLGTNEEPLYSIAKRKAASRGSKLIVANIDYTYRGRSSFPETLLEFYQYKDLKLENAKLGLLGKHQLQNSSLALTIFKELSERLGFKIDLQKVKKALENTRWEGRLEIVRETPLLVLDGAHNLHALRNSLETLKELNPFPFIVYGSMKDKDWPLQMELIRKYTDRIGLVEIDYHRSESLENLFARAVELGFREIRTYKRVGDLLENLKEDTVILGSLYLVGEVKKHLKVL